MSKHDNAICPVCGGYCLGKGGFGCIDKPGLCGYNTQSDAMCGGSMRTCRKLGTRRRTSTDDRIVIAMEVIERFGGIDGDHHKAWVIDQVARALKGNDYHQWVIEMKAGEDGPNTYGWEEGTPP